MGQSQDSTTQSQELTDEQKGQLETQRVAFNEKRQVLFDSLMQFENPEDRARERSKILNMIANANGLTNERVFMQMVANYPYTLEHEVKLEELEYEIADEYSTSHEVTTSIKVEEQYVDIDVSVDLHHAVYHGPSISITKNVEFDGCDIIDAYMEQAGTKNPVFFLAKVAEILFEKSNHEADMRTAVANERFRKVTEERDSLLASNKQLIAQLATAKEAERDLNAIISKTDGEQMDLLRDALNAKEELTRDFNKMQDRVFALTDIMKDILTDEPISISDVLNDALRNYGLDGAK